MFNSTQYRFAAALFVTSGLTLPLAAESTTFVSPAQNQADASSVDAQSELARFAPQSELREHRIDYEHWDEALEWLVVPMGPSIRETAPRVDPRTGTRRTYGHESRLRLEGNRLAFSYITPDIRQAISDYRADLERVGSELDISSLPRNEQLAYWLNLHNVAMVEALSGEYPMVKPDDRTFGPNETALDDAKLVTVAGVPLSPRDIREGIVYPNWRDPKVIYGFWRGILGGPSIQRLAFNGANVDPLLALSAEDFVNSLRGVERWGGALRVSPIYEEAKRFYFEDSEYLRAHLSQYARDEVRELVSETTEVAYRPLETDLADLSRGEREPSYTNLCVQPPGMNGGQPPVVDVANCATTLTRTNPAIQRLMAERAEKLERARRAGIRTGMVIFGDGRYAEGEAPPEVE
ncbi:hypothetical protein NAP1_09902 [Erythrobacter sp. NAP1]|uniref:DUF547 domain-containing protein n=1 Tax=Erythrobacter sp. NAP1 TaxID=237727 RepID=UPI0000685134|nr:DUF547 domain-containing protein [Erythrobacter sp. NAP1]EAQ27899.1 hypothetical protein NAP1_09902 [Erythrobacter sp. NAP1]